ncbi:teichoic acids export ABC transporter ATP-binding subunit TagH [Neobacillus niacini]|uniref:teichoic acids export ABC transporter ATP-binding subunit TagH n=1 Tax=Neobacillus niacini TaxID=86668 RepID=UPI003000D7D3
MEPKVKIRVKNVSKQYKLYKRNFEKILDVLPFSKVRTQNFHALRNISFDVNEGETIGIVGINGSGKSTLSNILAKVIPVTSGELDIRGETSLIAISVGLDKNLTGLDNITQKCLMHGLKTDEIKALTPDILEFAELGDFIEQPVKNYSSGMKARLGFAISIHTNPDILIIDEALSVGDQTFYQKCLDKIDEFKKSGKTIFFVSHSISQIRSISDRVMWIHYGEMQDFGEAESVLSQYGDFIKWYKNLSPDEKKEYKNNMNIKQRKDFQENSANGRLGRQARKKKNTNDKNDKKTSLTFQILLLLCFMVVSAWIMFDGKALKVNIDELKMNSQTVGKVETKEKKTVQEQIEKEGYVAVQTATLFSDRNLTTEAVKIPFTTTVYVEGKVDDVYKIKYGQLEAYTNANNIDISQKSDASSNIELKDVLKVMPTNFTNSYQFFLAQLSKSFTDVKGNLRGLTAEGNDPYGNRTLVFGNLNLTYIEGQDGETKSLIIDNINVADPMIGSLSNESILKSASGELLFLKINQYDAIVNMKDKTMQLTLSE